MSNNDSIETTAETAEQAIENALAQLGATKDDVTIEVIDSPRGGVLGMGAREARVRVTRRTAGGESAGSASAEPASEAGGPERKSVALEEQSKDACSTLSRILELMGEKAEVFPLEMDHESIEIEIKGDGSGLLIGRHGQTLDALEYLVNRALARRIKDAVAISLETESYRARRRDQLHRMALSMGERAKRDRMSVKLEPMPPRDRRVVHLALKDDPMLSTKSTGDGFLRAIEIVPVGGVSRPPREPGHGRRGGGGNRRDRERERPNEAIGEQGGFKHGQKRLF
ncbi:MAG TPA: RNA-binding cell elongation regulator Jag/EloR [Candidatus Binataceae bacterium]|nr:RNA-binding cell elongation regulator Jag/EloR [Candidatus Binataceae bacterium]